MALMDDLFLIPKVFLLLLQGYLTPTGRSTGPKKRTPTFVDPEASRKSEFPQVFFGYAQGRSPQVEIRIFKITAILVMACVDAKKKQVLWVLPGSTQLIYPHVS